MSRIALLAILTATALLAACNTTRGYNAKTETNEDRRFIFGVPQNDR